MKRPAIPTQVGIQDIFALIHRLDGAFGLPWIPDQRRNAAVRYDEIYGVYL